MRHVSFMKFHTNSSVRKSIAILVCVLLPQICCRATADDAAPLTEGRLKEEVRVAFTEGPLWHPDGRVLFSDIANNRIMQRAADGTLSVFRHPSGRTNGMAFDLQGRLICCEGGGLDSRRRISRTEADGTVKLLAKSYKKARFNSPNDVVVDGQGRVYFSDPRYGDKADMQQLDDDGKPIEGVYRIDAPDEVVRVIAHEVARPNGLAISPDGKYLYVADNVNDGPNAAGGNRKLWQFELLPNGDVNLKTQTLIYDWETDRGPDGLAVDMQGRVYAAAGFNYPKPPFETAGERKAGVYVIDPQKKELVQFIPVPIDMVTNCAFGDEDRKTLYITAGHKLWSIRTTTPGFTRWPATNASR